MHVNALTNQAIARPAFRLLIIEPDVVQGALVGELVRRSSPDYATVHAGSLAMGVELTAKEAFDAIWISTPMPGLTLGATLDKVVGMAGNTPVIAMLDQADARSVAAVHAHGAADVYSKQAEIAIHFRQLLRRRAARTLGSDS